METGGGYDCDTDLSELVHAVIDSTDVDWDTVETAALKDQRPLIQKLKSLSKLIRAHKVVRQSVDAVERRAEIPDLGSAPVIWGSLEIIERIGEGAFGEVFRARELQLDRDVALKLFHPQRLSASSSISKVIEEGRLLARVHHHNVVTVHGAIRHEGRVGIWMELIEGVTLEDILVEQGPLSPEDAMLIGRDICRALAELHSFGIIHRDIKSRNVMREKCGRIVLMDFGVSCEIDRHISVKQYGTPLYAAPEVLLRNESTPNPHYS